MDAITKLPKKQTYIILIAISCLIMSLSLETLMRVKDISLYDIWFAEMVTSDFNLSYDDAFSVYVTGNIAVYFMKIIVPIVFGIHTYFAYTKIRINKLFVFMWTVLLGGGIAYIAVGREFGSMFYYFNIATYIVLVLTTLSLNDVIDENRIK